MTLSSPSIRQVARLASLLLGTACMTSVASGQSIGPVIDVTAVVIETRDDAAIAEIPESPAARAPTTRASVDNRQAADPADPADPAALPADAPRAESEGVERVILFGPKGPLIAQVALLIDGEPYPRKREKIIEALLKGADIDGDGKSTWKEAGDNPRFAFGRFRQTQAILTEKQQLDFVRQYDHNADGLMDREEAIQLLGRLMPITGLQVTTRVGGTGEPNLLRILDSDSDGEISPREIAAASQKLERQDANGNDLLESNEAGGTMGGNNAFGGQSYRRFTPATDLPAMLLGPKINSHTVLEALRHRYGANNSLAGKRFATLPHFFEALDANANGDLDQDEVAGLNQLRPHLTLTVSFASGANGKSSVVVNWQDERQLSPEKGNDSGHQTLSTSGLRLQIEPPSDPYRMQDYSRYSTSMLTQYDFDKNGYIDRDEAKKSPNNRFVESQFARWDENGDGKVFAEEILADYQRQIEPQTSQLYLTAVEKSPSLFALLDVSGDKRLSLREMRTAGTRLQSLDANRNGTLESDEIPGEMLLTFSRGNAAAGGFRAIPVVVNGNSNVGAPAGAAPSSGPKWFAHMDKNGDGDLTQREFLGDEKLFRQIDRNGDGFIEPDEAAKIPESVKTAE